MFNSISTKLPFNATICKHRWRQQQRWRNGNELLCQNSFDCSTFVLFCYEFDGIYRITFFELIELWLFENTKFSLKTFLNLDKSTRNDFVHLTCLVHCEIRTSIFHWRLQSEILASSFHSKISPILFVSDNFTHIWKYPHILLITLSQVIISPLAYCLKIRW